MAGGSSVSTSEEKGSKSVDKRLPEFTIDELLAEIKPEECQDGLGYIEICQRWDWPLTWTNIEKVRYQVYKLLVAGGWEVVGRKRIWHPVHKQEVTVKVFRPVQPT